MKKVLILCALAFLMVSCKEEVKVVKGKDGLNGVDGVSGTKGDTGMVGPKGDQGVQGLMGPKGEQGMMGPKGDRGPEGQQGPAGINCDNSRLDDLENRVMDLENNSQGSLDYQLESPSNSTHSYSVRFRVVNNYNFTVGAFKVKFDIPDNVTTITCSGSVDNPVMDIQERTVTLSPRSPHTFWILSSGMMSGILTCQVERPSKASGYSDNKFTNMKVVLL